jgi:hypothetical protein
LDNIIETSSAIGMINLKKYAQRLIDKWIINETEVSWLMKGPSGSSGA